MENYINFCQYMRSQAVDADEKFPILDFNGRVFLIDPAVEKVQEVLFRELDSFGPFGAMKELTFPDEAQNLPTDEKNL